MSAATKKVPTRSASDNERYAFMAVAAKHMVVGDLVANHGTCTAVEYGPSKGTNKWDALRRGDVRYRCGASFSCAGDGDRSVIVGKRRAS